MDAALRSLQASVVEAVTILQRDPTPLSTPAPTTRLPCCRPRSCIWLLSDN